MPLFGSTPIDFGQADTGAGSTSPVRPSSDGFADSILATSPSTVIAKGVRLEGEFKGQGNILIEGSVHGTLQTDGELTVGPDAEVHAGITAVHAVIAGTVEGNVKVRNRLEIKSTAHVKGDLSCEMITVEAGAQLQGNLSCRGVATDMEPEDRLLPTESVSEKSESDIPDTEITNSEIESKDASEDTVSA